MAIGDDILSNCSKQSDANNGTVCVPGTVPDILAHFNPPLWNNDLPMAMMYAGVLLVASVVGAVGNIVILVINIATDAMSKVGREFVINMAIADLCVNFLAEPLCILSVVKGEEWFVDRSLLCELIASLCFTACVCAFLNLSALTLNKYLFVCHNDLFQRFYTRRVAITICVLNWIIAFFTEFPSSVGWGGRAFDKKANKCYWDRTASVSYAVFVCFVLIAVPLMANGVGYMLIFRKIWMTKKRVFDIDNDDPLRGKKAFTEALKTSRTLVVVFFVFFVCWAPYSVTILIDLDDTFPKEVYLTVAMISHLHSSFNFPIYMTFNKNFNQIVKKMFACIPVSKWKYQSSHYKSTTTSKSTASSRFHLPSTSQTFSVDDARPSVGVVTTKNPTPDSIQPLTSKNGKSCSTQPSVCEVKPKSSTTDAQLPSISEETSKNASLDDIQPSVRVKTILTDGTNQTKKVALDGTQPSDSRPLSNNSASDNSHTSQSGDVEGPGQDKGGHANQAYMEGGDEDKKIADTNPTAAI